MSSRTMTFAQGMAEKAIGGFIGGAATMAGAWMVGSLINKVTSLFSEPTKLVDFNSTEYTRGLQMAIDNRQRGMASENQYLYSNPAYARAATDTAAAYYMEAQKMNKDYDPKYQQQQFLNSQLLMGSSMMYGGVNEGIKEIGKEVKATARDISNYFSPKQSYNRGLAEAVYTGSKAFRESVVQGISAPINAIKNIFIR